jgi:alpha-tubulin suppressor-like RCC1 family protein
LDITGQLFGQGRGESGEMGDYSALWHNWWGFGIIAGTSTSMNLTSFYIGNDAGAALSKDGVLYIWGRNDGGYIVI